MHVSLLDESPIGSKSLQQPQQSTETAMLHFRLNKFDSELHDHAKPLEATVRALRILSFSLSRVAQGV